MQCEQAIIIANLGQSHTITAAIMVGTAQNTRFLDTGRLWRSRGIGRPRILSKLAITASMAASAKNARNNSIILRASFTHLMLPMTNTREGHSFMGASGGGKPPTHSLRQFRTLRPEAVQFAVLRADDNAAFADRGRRG
jgi:hypothetical protein